MEEKKSPEPTWPRVANNAIFAAWSIGVFIIIAWVTR